MRIKFNLLLIVFFTIYSTVSLSQEKYFKNTDTSYVSIDKYYTPKSILKKVVFIFDSVKNEGFYIGAASFYSSNLEGTETTTGETFKHEKLTCASNRFKLNTWLRVTNLSNGKSIIVRVNDRMHPRMDKKGRIVDLSYSGAKKLQFVSSGVTNVKVEIVNKGTKK